MEPYVLRSLKTNLSDVSTNYFSIRSLKSFSDVSYSVMSKTLLLTTHSILSAYCMLCWEKQIKMQVTTAKPILKLCLEFPDLHISKCPWKNFDFLEYDTFIYLSNGHILHELSRLLSRNQIRASYSQFQRQSKGTSDNNLKFVINFIDLFFISIDIYKFQFQDQARIEAAVETLTKKLHPGAFSEISSSW